MTSDAASCAIGPTLRVTDESRFEMLGQSAMAEIHPPA